MGEEQTYTSVKAGKSPSDHSISVTIPNKLAKWLQIDQGTLLIVKVDVEGGRIIYQKPSEALAKLY